MPLRTFADWDDVRPGFVEADLVAHCGTSTAGSYVHTLTLTDVSTGWTECLALPYRDQEAVLQALKVGRTRLPFELLGLDTDNGSEFLNYGLLDYCARERITFTRSRAYKKNDQCHVEEKNGSVVRRFVGYDRFEGLEACRVLSELHAVLRLYVNFFQPSMKLVSKHREGSKVAGKYDVAQTPYQRALASDQVSEEVKRRLRRRYHKLGVRSRCSRRSKHCRIGCGPMPTCRPGYLRSTSNSAGMEACRRWRRQPRQPLPNPLSPKPHRLWVATARRTRPSRPRLGAPQPSNAEREPTGRRSGRAAITS